MPTIFQYNDTDKQLRQMARHITTYRSCNFFVNFMWWSLYTYTSPALLSFFWLLLFLSICSGLVRCSQSWLPCFSSWWPVLNSDQRLTTPTYLWEPRTQNPESMGLMTVMGICLWVDWGWQRWPLSAGSTREREILIERERQAYLSWTLSNFYLLFIRFREELGRMIIEFATYFYNCKKRTSREQRGYVSLCRLNWRAKFCYIVFFSLPFSVCVNYIIGSSIVFVSINLICTALLFHAICYTAFIDHQSGKRQLLQLVMTKIRIIHKLVL